MSCKIRVSLRIEHPNLRPEAISNALGLVPKWSRAVGEVRKTPKGQLLEGINSETYWLHEFDIPKDEDTERSLAMVVDTLREKKIAFQQLSKSGATHELSVGIFLEKDTGLDLNHSLLGCLADIDVSLSLSIYTPEITGLARAGA